MKHTIRGKYTLVITGLIGVLIVVLCLMNSLYMERYYISEKIDTMKETYSQVNLILTEGSVDDENTRYSIGKICENGNTSALLYVDGAWLTVGYENRLEQQMYSLLLGQLGDDVQLLESADEYMIYQGYDSKLNTSYLLYIGFLDEGGPCFLRSSLTSLKESAIIATRFTWIIGTVLIVISIFLGSIISRQISGPITRLSHIADRMAHMDFSVRYEGKETDEIGLLGNSMNYMAQELENRINELRRANEQLQRDIREKVKVDEMRKEFISNVSHELKTPIALIQGYAEGLLDGISEDPESMSYYCEVIVDEAGKMNQLVRKLLTLNQIESGINRVELVDFDLTSLVKGVLHSFAIMVQQKNIEVEFDSSKKVTIRADEFMMEEVVRNYISNAINHIDGERRIAVEILQTPEKTRFSVFNTGQPIPEGELNNVWQKFYKVDKARTREYGGSGIGLSIVKAVMDSHKGTCGVYNTEDGVCFWFELKRLELPAVVTAVPQAVKPQERKFQERKFQERKSVQKRGGKESRKDTNFLFF